MRRKKELALKWNKIHRWKCWENAVWCRRSHCQCLTMCQDAGFCFHCCQIWVCRTRSGSRRGENPRPGRWHGSGAGVGSGACWREGPDAGAAGSRAPGRAGSAIRTCTVCCFLYKDKSEWPIKYTAVINWSASNHSTQHTHTPSSVAAWEELQSLMEFRRMAQSSPMLLLQLSPSSSTLKSSR